MSKKKKKIYELLKKIEYFIFSRTVYEKKSLIKRTLINNALIEMEKSWKWSITELLLVALYGQLKRGKASALDIFFSSSEHTLLDER